MHEHGARRRDANLPVQRNVRGEVGEQEAGAGRVRRAVRQREGPVRVDRDALGIAAAARTRERQHATAVEVARDLGAGDERQVRHLRIEAVADQQVGEVHAGSAHVHDGIALRLGDILDGQVAADLAKDGRPHPSSLCDQRRTSSP